MLVPSTAHAAAWHPNVSYKCACRELNSKAIHLIISIYKIGNSNALRLGLIELTKSAENSQI